MGQTLVAYLGADRSWELTLRKDGVVSPYPADAELDASVWRGDDESPLFSPDIAPSEPDGPDEGKVILTVLRSHLAGKEPGVYALRAGVTWDDFRSVAFDGHLEIRGTAGSGVVPKVYSSEDELLREYDQLRNLSGEFDQTGYLEVRGDVRQRLIEWWVDEYRPMPGFVRTRQPAFDPIFGFDRPDPLRAPPTRQQLRSWLDADRLILGEPIVKAYCKLVVAIILDRQEVEQPRNGYRENADALRREAYEILHCTPLRIDTTTVADGIADVEILHDAVTYLAPEVP